MATDYCQQQQHDQPALLHLCFLYTNTSYICPFYCHYYLLLTCFFFFFFFAISCIPSVATPRLPRQDAHQWRSVTLNAFFCLSHWKTYKPPGGVLFCVHLYCLKRVDYIWVDISLYGIAAVCFPMPDPLLFFCVGALFSWGRCKLAYMHPLSLCWVWFLLSSSHKMQNFREKAKDVLWMHQDCLN